MKNIFFIILAMGLSQVAKSQYINDSYTLYTKEYIKLSPLDFKHNRFQNKPHTSFVEVKSLKRIKLSSPNYKNHFDKFQADMISSMKIVSSPIKLKGPNYKNRRFK